MNKTASEMRAEITLLKDKVASLEQQREARTDALKAAHEAQIEADRATLEKLTTIKLDLDVDAQAVTAPMGSGDLERQYAGTTLLRGLADARVQVELIRSGLEYRIKYGAGADQELARIDDALSRARAELAGAEEKFAEARAAAAAWLAA